MERRCRSVVLQGYWRRSVPGAADAGGVGLGGMPTTRTMHCALLREVRVLSLTPPSSSRHGGGAALQPARAAGLRRGAGGKYPNPSYCPPYNKRGCWHGRLGYFSLTAQACSAEGFMYRVHARVAAAEVPRAVSITRRLSRCDAVLMMLRGLA